MPYCISPAAHKVTVACEGRLTWRNITDILGLCHQSPANILLISLRQASTDKSFIRLDGFRRVGVLGSTETSQDWFFDIIGRLLKELNNGTVGGEEDRELFHADSEILGGERRVNLQKGTDPVGPPCSASFKDTLIIIK